jgi:hypothetical protein
MWFYRKAFGPESFQDISGVSAFYWHHVFPSETHRVQFFMDLDVNATDERIYSEFLELLQIFLLDVSRDVVSVLE